MHPLLRLLSLFLVIPSCYGDAPKAIDCGGNLCVGHEQCVNDTCVCIQPYFEWLDEGTDNSTYTPCGYELCGGNYLSSDAFQNYTKSLISSKSNENVGVYDSTDYLYCQNGHCQETINHLQKSEYGCECQEESYLGVHCEYSWDLCSSYPCLNGGTCVPNNETDGKIFTYTCACPEPFTGPLCYTMHDVCQSQPCLNGGMCINFNSGEEDQHFTCLCAAGYDGGTCEDDSRRKSVDQTRTAVLSATVFLLICMVMCCFTTSGFRMKEKQMLGIQQAKITAARPVLLERLYMMKDAINRLEENGGLREFAHKIDRILIIPVSTPKNDARNSISGRPGETSIAQPKKESSLLEAFHKARARLNSMISTGSKQEIFGENAEHLRSASIQPTEVKTTKRESTSRIVLGSKTVFDKAKFGIQSAANVASNITKNPPGIIFIKKKKRVNPNISEKVVPIRKNVYSTKSPRRIPRASDLRNKSFFN